MLARLLKINNFNRSHNSLNSNFNKILTKKHNSTTKISTLLKLTVRTAYFILFSKPEYSMKEYYFLLPHVVN